MRLSTQVNFRRMNSPEVESTVQYSTVQYNVQKYVMEEGRREEGDQLGFFLWIKILNEWSTGQVHDCPFP